MKESEYKKNSQAEKNQETDGNLEEKKVEKEIEQKNDQKLEEYGQITLNENVNKRKIQLISIIGEVEGHENLSSNSKTTKYDHILPKLAEIEDDSTVEGLLVILNTSGGDVDAGLAISEMIASMSLPTVSLVLGGSHSIGVPLAVCTDYSFIVPTGTMMVHPVRMSGMVIGASQTYEYFEMIQDRILKFVSSHAVIAYDQLRRLMLNTEMLTRDLGTVLVGEETVKEGLINEVGGIKEALNKLYELMESASS
ncbi:ATP-dependent Clp protease proteolytic subunit [Clostridium sp. E02]|uniref:ClpP family protease n=1 Tax=Clostridium sp. E02 TaxID=2487134 RepID=UPI000F53AA33|nr:ATP-dependent Clp protease proteolytic subunit [Clostridium sp. E02]